MEHFLQKLKKLRDLIVFDRESKAACRARLVAYLRGAEAVRTQNIVRLSSYKSPLLTIIKNKYMPIVAVALILAILGGGTSFAAEGSLPGDLLYPVKVKVNEQVAAALRVSDDSKARFQAELAEKRLKEANALAAQGRLDSEVEVELERAFESSAGKVEIHLRSLESSGSTTTAAEIGAKFSEILRAYTAAIQAGASSTEALRRISASVNLVIEASGRDRDRDRSRSRSEDGLSDDRSGEDGNRERNRASSSTNPGEDGPEIEIEVEHGVEIEGLGGGLNSSSSGGISVEDDSSPEDSPEPGDDSGGHGGNSGSGDSGGGDDSGGSSDD